MNNLQNRALSDERQSLVELKAARKGDDECIDACNGRIADIDKQLKPAKSKK